MCIHSRYPGKASQKDYIDLGLTTPFLGSRGFESLKFWLFIKGTGINAIEKLIERRHELSRFWYNLLSNNKNIVVLNNMDFYRIAFVIFPKEKLKDFRKINDKEKIGYLISKYTKIVSDKIYKEGKVCIDEFKLKDFNKKLSDYDDIDYLVMGTTIANASTDEKNLLESEKILSQAIDKIINKYTDELDNLIKNKAIGSKYKIKNSSPSSWS
ncbi:MAG: hypothetical protein DDT40_01363 [candidate division WS2 bacterium]|nr:hypothetical protein [Candidatus Psychracetigena formicireducens]